MKRKGVSLGGIMCAVAFTIGVSGISIAFADTTGALLPTGEGYSLQWTPSTGVTHYTLVDESACNGTTDYVQTTTVGQRDAYGVNISSLLVGSTITAVAIQPCASRVNTGGANPVMNVFYRFDGTNSADSGSYALTGTTPTDLATTTFSGLSKVVKATSTLQVGVVLTSGTKGARLSRIATVVTYTLPALSAPSSLSATPSTSSTTLINLSWTDNSTDETGFLIERGLSTSTFSQIASVGASVTTYADGGVSAGTKYYYRVRATDTITGRNSSYSNTASATTGAIPSAPSLSVYTSTTTPNDVQLSFSSSGATSYTIERSFTSTSSFSFLATTSNTFYTDVAPGSGTWWYRTTASNNYGTSGYSSAGSVTLP